MSPLVHDFEMADLADIAMVSLLIWLVIVWIRTTRLRHAALALALIGGLHLLVQVLELELTALILQAFFAVAAIVMIVVFQDDLHRLFDWIGSLRLGRRLEPPPGIEQTVSRTLFGLAEEHVGALVVLPGRECLRRHLEGGETLGGRASEPLLRSLFDPHSPGHDGAVVLRGERIERFGARLPLTRHGAQLEQRGTRHAAALGLAERSDALTVAVSEETGAVSIARDGALREVPSARALAAELRTFAAPQDPRPEARRRRLASRWPEALVSVLAAGILWVAVVPGSAVDRVSRPVSIEVANLPPGFELSGVEPPAVEVTFEGRRRDVFLATPSSMSVRIDAILVQLGRRTFQLDADQVVHPDELSVVDIAPGKVRLSVRRVEEHASQPATPRSRARPARS
ncbi:MAG: diadenylate cyclase [Myxococcota bacterium]|nr:diadenylate cyclase [Myxococcota bacterium]